jgi:hypothetical protein
MLTPTQAFLKLFLLFLVVQAVAFAAIIWYFDLTTSHIVGLIVIALIFQVIFAIRTWNKVHRIWHQIKDK